MRPTSCLIAPVVVATLLISATLQAATYYVAPTGSDSAAGTETAPFATWAKAQSVVSPGDTVYFRGGTYRYTDATSTCTSTTVTVNDVVLNKSGTSTNTINYFAYPGEKPVFDFSGVNDTSKYSCRQVGVNVQADWLHLKGLEFKGVLQLNSDNHESWCVYLTGGSDNLFEQLDAHHNMGPGFFVQAGGNNTFLNCDSHENEDTLTSNGDGQSADGFGCHPKNAGDTGNVFHGCRSWWNSDDAFDFINSQEACKVEYSWAWYSGYKPDAIVNGQPVELAAGNGNGFKAGGYGDPQTNVPAVPPQHVVQMNAAFYNKASGLYANHEIVSPFFYNNTVFNNGTDVDMLGLDGTTVTSVGMLRNNIAFSTNGHTLLSNMNNGGPISDEYNSWDSNMNITVSAADFQSIEFAPPASCPQAYTPGGNTCISPTDTTSFAGMASARQADGSLPNLPFLHLAANSPLIARGTNVGLPYGGTTPDLGCFQTGVGYDVSDGGVADAGLPDSSTPDAFAADNGMDGAAVDSSTSVSDSGARVDTGATADVSVGDSAIIETGVHPAPDAPSADSSIGSSSDTQVNDTTADAGGSSASSGGCSCSLAAHNPSTPWRSILLVLGATSLAIMRRKQAAKNLRHATRGTRAWSHR